MQKERLRKLFTAYDPAIQRVISEVLIVEQEHISIDRPRVKDQIEEIIDRVAKQELGTGNKK
jgi:hypothetical protein